MGMTQAIDITPEQRKTILSLLTTHLPNTEAWAYGSRVRWTSRPESDLDMVVFAKPEQARNVSNLREAFEESNLPFRVDPLVWHEVSESYRREIERKHVVLVACKDHGASHETLGDYFNLQRGMTYKSNLLGQDGPTLLGLASIGRNGGFREEKLRTYGGECPDKLLVNAGELYVSLKDVTQSADLLGAVAMLPKQYAPGRLTQDTVKLKPKRDDVPLDYIHWLLRTPQYRHYCRAYATGTTNLGLPRQDFLAFPVPALIPSRRRVVEALGALDDKIELNRRMNESLEAMARAIFKDWFVDFGPTHAKMTGIEPYLPPKIWSSFPDALDNKGKPEGWEFDTLARLAATNPESWTTRHHPPVVEYVDLSNAKWGNIRTTAFLDWEHAPSRARRVAKTGDTIVGTTRPGNGSFAYISRDGLTVSTGFAVLSPLTAKYRDAVYLAATSAENIKRLASLAHGHGGTYPAVKPVEVSDTALVFPGDDVLAAFAKLVSPIRDRAERSKVEIQTLTQTRDLLLPKLVFGEIRTHKIENLEVEACTG